MTLLLSRIAFGRMILHLICLAHDRNWRWHCTGIQREFHKHSARPTRDRKCGHHFMKASYGARSICSSRLLKLRALASSGREDGR